MKAMVLLTAVAAAIMAFHISAASSQGACMQEYQACMTSCSTKPVKALQSACFDGCEGKNTQCAEKIYGKRPFNGAPSDVAEQKGKAKDALAKTAKEPAKSREQAPVQERASQQERAPAVQQPSPVRR